jgi:HEAT repeat protein
LADLDSPEAINRAIDAALADLVDRERESDAMSRLTYLGEKAFDAVARGTKSENPVVARWCCVVLRHRGDRAIAPLIEALKTTSGASIRSIAALETGQTFQPRAVPALIEALDDPDASVRQSAIWALMSLRDRRAIEPLQRHIDDNGYGHVATMAVNHILEPQGYAWWPPDRLDDWQLCQDAHTLKGETFGPAERERLIKLIDSEEWAISTAALLALGHLDVRSAVPAIIALRASETKFSVLATIGTPEAFEQLVASLQSPRQDVRQAALNGIANGADRWGAPLLVAMLDDASLRIEKHEIPPLNGGATEWPEEHRAHAALCNFFSRFGLRGRTANLARGVSVNVPDEISRFKEWWKVNARDFLAGRSVPNPELTSVMYNR